MGGLDCGAPLTDARRMINALLVDDEPLARSRMRTLLRDYEDFAVAGEAGDGTEALRAIETLRPDVVFLDVEMPDLDGFGLVRRLGRDARPLLVFVTAYEEYALDAFRASAAHYLLKPVDPHALRQAVERVRKLLDTPLERVAVKRRGRTLLFRVDEIDWVEAAGNYVRLHVAGQRHLLRETMAGIERKLDRRCFTRIHRSVIVNLGRIRELQGASHGDATVVLRDGTQLTLSRAYRDRIEPLLGRL
jgi:two-component system, LytTR family, response regulator